MVFLITYFFLPLHWPSFSDEKKQSKRHSYYQTQTETLTTKDQRKERKEVRIYRRLACIFSCPPHDRCDDDDDYRHHQHPPPPPPVKASNLTATIAKHGAVRIVEGRRRIIISFGLDFTASILNQSLGESSQPAAAASRTPNANKKQLAKRRTSP